ncbi:MAG: ATP-grasp domain-containing protein [Cyanobacteria bacterium NC_groundwater_1444_Ag_S-0.65um_54_12]|nr:ATP-grasp domain-containing protein [Cyanobacteria bacterium NC_groundwater_1444_Ag_S-0.65um_54_12]
MEKKKVAVEERPKVVENITKQPALPEEQPLNILCVACVVSGRPFMLEAKRRGHKVFVMTSEKSLGQEWPRDQIAEVFAIKKFFDEKEVRNTVSYLARYHKIDRIVPMGDFDVEIACMLREHMRIPGMGETTMRYFRDKLAMRMKAREDDVPVPDFVHILHHDDVYRYMLRVPPPWVLKPRQEAASMGVKLMHDDQEVWREIEKLGDKQSLYLLEKYLPGAVYHVDSVVSEREVLFAGVSKYGKPMLDLNVSGGVYTTCLIDRRDPDWQALQELNKKVIASLGLVRGVTHIEYIKEREEGKFYFLEAGARVGAAKIPDVLWHATDICLWWEWVRIETQKHYELPPFREEYAGAVVTLARQEWPDLSAYNDPEVCWVQKKKYHAGIVVKSPDPARVETLTKQYAERFAHDFMAHVPRKETT